MTTGLINVAFGSNTRLAYLIQDEAGVIDTTPEWKVLPFSSAEPNVEAEQMQDPSMTGDRNMLQPRSGVVNGQITASGKFRPEALDDLLEAAMQGTWGNKYEVSGLTVEVVDDEGTFSFVLAEGEWEDYGVEVGDSVAFSGFTGDHTDNNTTVNVTALSPGGEMETDAIGLSAVAEANDIAMESDMGNNFLKVGSTRRAIAWEIYHADADEYVRIIDTELSQFSIQLQSNGDVTFSLTAIGGSELDLGEDIADPVAGATYVTTDAPFYDSFNGYVELDGNPAIYFSELSPSLDNQSSPLFAIGNRYPIAVAHQKMNAEMSMTAYYQDETIKQKYQSEDVVKLKLQIKYEDVADTNTDYHVFTYPSAKITNFGRPVAGEGELMDNVTILPFKHDGLGSSVLIQKHNPTS